ncbi:MAG: hypothetical protein K0R92_1234 [Lachnospiraceae bacterium]|jgi:hypothetical protein|nr:hypothetical protein [Lachnospiraceae bacterium]
MKDIEICNCNCNGPSGDDGSIRVQDAIIEEINFIDRIGHVTISYGIPGDFNMIHMELVTLIVSQDTVIRNESGRSLSMRDLREGMLVDVVFSSAMTMSIPPQARAFRIIVKNSVHPFDVTVDNVLRVDTRNNFLYTGTLNDRASQIRFVITNATVILDRRGRRIDLRDLRVGETVRVEHANFMTRSIPPQTTAFRVQVLF